MKRRTLLKTIVAAGTTAADALAAAPGRAIQLHVDLAVDPAREKEMLHNFETIFRPEAVRHQGYIDVKMLKLRTALQGSVPAGINYRFSLTYRSEELRQKWVASQSTSGSGRLSRIRSRPRTTLSCYSTWIEA